MSCKRVNDATRLDGLRQSGASRLMFPRSADGHLHGVVVNTAGGITGGDRFSLTAHAAAQTNFTLTTQAAERAYRAQPGQTGTINTSLTAQDDACLHWLPQETILFNGCAITRRLTIDLHPKARLLMCEPVIFGRTAMGEGVTNGQWTDAITITRNGSPHLTEQTRLSGNIAAHLDRPAIANGARAMATVIYIAPDAATHLGSVRACLAPTCGASLVHPDTLVVRLLAADGYALRQTLVPVLTTITGQPLPRPWMT